MRNGYEEGKFKEGIVMKANGAPEKIYLERVLCSNEVYDTWKSQKTISDDIEYTRTDAFIEKASTWIANRYQANGSYLNADDIEDFEKYMGE